MAPARRSQSKGRTARLVTPCVIFILTTNVAYQVCRGVWRPKPSVVPLGTALGSSSAQSVRTVSRIGPKGGLASNWVGADRDGTRQADAEVDADAGRPVDVLEGGGSDAAGDAMVGAAVEAGAAAGDKENVIGGGGGGGGGSIGGASGGNSLPEARGIHVMCTSNGSPYLNWQTRIMYRTFLDVQPGSDMLHFTRLLHRRTDDELMAEVPTVRVDSLHAPCDRSKAEKIITLHSTPYTLNPKP